MVCVLTSSTISVFSLCFIFLFITVRQQLILVFNFNTILNIIIIYLFNSFVVAFIQQNVNLFSISLCELKNPITHRTLSGKFSFCATRKEIFYLTTHSTHFIYGYMASVFVNNVQTLIILTNKIVVYILK